MWHNEMLRVFRDRLGVEGDRAVFDQVMLEQLKKYFPGEIPALGKPMYFLACGEEKSYKMLIEREAVVKLIKHAIEDGGTPIEIFDHAIDNILRIERSICFKQGNLLLVGISGTGKQSLCKIACQMLNSEIHNLKIYKNNFREYKKELCDKLIYEAGVVGSQQTLLFTDSEENEFVMEELSNLICSYDINIEKDQQEKFSNGLEEMAQFYNIQEGKVEFYKQRLQSNFHLIVSLSLLNKNLKQILRNFPQFINQSTINWMTDWPQVALTTVAEEKLQPLNLNNAKIPQCCVYVHQKALQITEMIYQQQGFVCYSTPKNYLDFISMFKSLYE